MRAATGTRLQAADDATSWAPAAARGSPTTPPPLPLQPTSSRARPSNRRPSNRQPSNRQPSNRPATTTRHDEAETACRRAWRDDDRRPTDRKTDGQTRARHSPDARDGSHGGGDEPRRGRRRPGLYPPRGQPAAHDGAGAQAGRVARAAAARRLLALGPGAAGFCAAARARPAARLPRQRGVREPPHGRGQPGGRVRRQRARRARAVVEADGAQRLRPHGPAARRRQRARPRLCRCAARPPPASRALALC